MKKTAMVLFLLFGVMCFAQQTITGIVKDAKDNPLSGVNVSVKESSVKTVTNFDGSYSIEADSQNIIVFSHMGFQDKEVKANDQRIINVIMHDGSQIDEIILIGSRALPRSSTTSSLPVDVLPVKDLVSTGQVTFDKALQYRIPSFNTVQTPVNDATALLDPYEIRNMGPSRTLILINGKRKNLSSLLYTQTSPGQGETGADISAIPIEAIKRVEILRDGASAQYGSDAIAGVMNIILKDSSDQGSATLTTGITSEGDGKTIGISLNNGSKIGKDKGFVNYTVDFSKVNLANRPGTVDAQGEFDDFVFTNPNNKKGVPEPDVANIIIGNKVGKASIDKFLKMFPDAKNINGSPETSAAKFLINAGYDLSKNTELYLNAAYVYKKVNSFANYRTPYWRRSRAFNPDDISGIDYFPYLNNFFPDGPNGEYIGYLPTFEGELNDYNGTIGFKTEKNGWNYDISYTTGGNAQDYTVRNSHNRNAVFAPSFDDANGNGVADPGEGFVPVELYRRNSPVSFKPGGTKFTHNVGNLDVAKVISDRISIGFGSEFRSETFEILPGDLASYDQGGADSFAGNRPENSGKFNRYNFGGYLDIAADITKNFLVNGTVRLEDYSDFGEAFVWKLSSRYKFLEDKLTLRGSLSTGFRAPTLHQIYSQKAQYSFVPGQGVQVGGFINNVSPQAKLLNIPSLKPEESTNITVGVGAKLNKNINLTVDYYNIEVDDRIVLSTEIIETRNEERKLENTALNKVMKENNLSRLSFFTNAIDTRTSGIDFVAHYNNINIKDGKLSFSLSGNYTIENKRVGAVKNPKIVADAGQSVVNQTQEALFFTSRPKTKWILGTTYDIGKFGFSLYNTYFGKTTFRQAGLNAGLKTEFIPKIVTDLGITYNFTTNLMVALNVNNVFNVLPAWKFKALNANGKAILNDPVQVKESSNLITFNQRYSQTTYDGYHFSQLGTIFNLSLRYKF